MLFDPGSVIVPRALSKGGRSIELSGVITDESHARFARGDDTAKQRLTMESHGRTHIFCGLKFYM